MAEKLIARQTGNQIPPELRKQYLEVRQVEANGRIVIWGIDKVSKKQKQIGYKKLVKAFNKDPESKFKPEPAQGVWGGSGGERAVTVVGVHGVDKDNRPLMRIRGSKEKVPRSEIKWIDSNGSSVEVKQLKGEINDLRNRLQEMEDKFDVLVNQKNRVEAENRKLSTRNEELESQVNAYQDKIDNYGSLTIEPEQQSIDSDSKARKGWNRTTGWIGSHLQGNKQPPYTNAYIQERDGGPVVVAREESVDGYTYYDRRRGAVALLGTAAAVGAAVLLAWAWGEHEENEGPDRAPAVTLPTLTHAHHDATADHGSRHEVLLHGNKAFKVSLPGNLEWEENDNGSFRIDDTEGHHIVPHVYWDQQGDLDVDSRQLLLTTPYHNFHLEQKSYDYHTPGTDYDRHYETVVLNG